MTERLHFHFSLSCIGEGNGNPLQCSCLENPRDEGAWWAAAFGVAQSRTRLKWLSSSSIGEIKQYLSFSVCLISLSIMPSIARFPSFSWLNSTLSYIYTHHSYLIQSSVSEHLGCLHVLSIVNNAAVNIRYRYFFEILIFFYFGYNPGVALLDHMVVLFLFFE